MFFPVNTPWPQYGFIQLSYYKHSRTPYAGNSARWAARPLAQLKVSQNVLLYLVASILETPWFPPHQLPENLALHRESVLPSRSLSSAQHTYLRVPRPITKRFPWFLLNPILFTPRCWPLPSNIANYITLVFCTCLNPNYSILLKFAPFEYLCSSKRFVYSTRPVLFISFNKSISQLMNQILIQ